MDKEKKQEKAVDAITCAMTMSSESKMFLVSSPVVVVVAGVLSSFIQKNQMQIHYSCTRWQVES